MNKPATDPNETYVYRVGDSLYLNLTNRCCNACAFCIRTYADGVGGSSLWLTREPTADELRRAIDAVDFAYDEAVFCGYGEPTYRLDLITAAADHLHSSHKTVRLNTNGLGNLIHGRDIVPDLIGRIDTVSISLNESDAARYDALCKSIYGLNAFPAMLAFTKSCTAHGLNTVLSVVDTGSIDIPACERLANESGAHLRIRTVIQ